MPSEVRAHLETGRFHDIEVEDDVTAFMKYDDGKTGVFITTTGEAPGTNRLEIAAERGRLVLEGSSIKWIRNETPTAQFCEEAKTGFEKPNTWNIEIPFNDNGEQHIGIFKNFVDAILNEGKLTAPAAEGINSVELANSMIFSGLQDTTVKLPLDAEAYEKLLKANIANSTHVKKVVESTGADSGFNSSF